MKQLLFLLLFPCLAMAQYQGNGNQKITLGEQTTADGLVYRGVASTDTVTATSKITRANKQDTSAYLLLDTVTNLLWHYKIGSNAWKQAGGGDTSLIAYVNTYGTQTVNGAKTFTSAVTATRFNPTSSTATGTGMYLPLANTLGFTVSNEEFIRISSSGRVGINNSNPITFLDVSSGDLNTVANLRSTDPGAFMGFADNTTTLDAGISTSSIGVIGDNFIINTANSEKMRITSAGEVWIGYTADNGAYPLQVNGQIFATNATIATSDEKFKENITPLNKGLEIINKLKPVTFNFISDTENNFSEYEEVGFIAQDVDRALSTETFAKSIVKAADDSDPTSTMGLATQNLIPVLVKAIQEQQALIKALEQRIINLENK